MTLETLQTRYVELTGALVDKRWKLDTLKSKVNDLEAQKRKEELAAARLKREREIEEEMRQVRIASRGEFETFNERVRRSDRNDYFLGRVTSWATRVIGEHEATTAKFASELAKNPQYAMSWSDSYFAHAGSYMVAMQIKGMFEGGVEQDSMLNTVLEYVVRGTRHPSRSTSPAHNLAAAEELRAWAEVANMLRGNSF